MSKKTVLIAPETANLAETHRMVSFAEAFRELGHHVVMLGDGRYDSLFADKGFDRATVEYDREWMTEEKLRMMLSLDEYGMEWISVDELNRFVDEELAVLERINPDAVLTGFRPTMSISTKISGHQLVWVLGGTVSDPYFEKCLATVPFGRRPDNFLYKMIPEAFSNRLMKILLLNLPVRIKPWNTVMGQRGLGKFTNSLKLVRGDYNLMSDAEELFPEFGDLPPYYGFCGPLLMSTDITMPGSVTNYEKKANRPLVFFAMGSSGDPKIFSAIVAAFDGQPYDVFAASTSIIAKDEIPFIPGNVIVEKMYPAYDITKMADAAVIHGGQGTVYTTVMAGTPFVGVPMFSEQQYNLETFARRRCGLVLNRGELTAEKVIASVEHILSDRDYGKNASSMGDLLAKYIDDPTLAARTGVEKILRFLETPENSYFKLKGL